MELRLVSFLLNEYVILLCYVNEVCGFTTKYNIMYILFCYVTYRLLIVAISCHLIAYLTFFDSSQQTTSIDCKSHSDTETAEIRQRSIYTHSSQFIVDSYTFTYSGVNLLGILGTKGRIPKTWRGGGVGCEREYPRHRGRGLGQT